MQNDMKTGIGTMSPSRQKAPLSSPFRWFVIFMLGFFLGIGVCVFKANLDEKLLQLPQGGPYYANVWGLCDKYWALGTLSFEPCEDKVDQLHNVIETADGELVSSEAGALIASILLDGRDCNCFLAEYVHSNTPIPAVSPFGFRHLHDSQLAGEVVNTEGELMLWMLDRLNPKDRLTLNLAQGLAALGDGYSNLMVTDYWIGVVSEECDK